MERQESVLGFYFTCCFQGNQQISRQQALPRATSVQLTNPNGKSPLV